MSKKSSSKTSRIVGHMEIARQLAVFVANKPGTFASVCEVLADHKINIRAMSTSDTTDHSVVRLILDNPSKALHIFEEHGMLVVSTNVLVLETASKVGILATIARCLTKNNINIEYAYCATTSDTTRGIVVLRMHPLAKAMKVLNTCKI